MCVYSQFLHALCSCVVQICFVFIRFEKFAAASERAQLSCPVSGFARLSMVFTYLIIFPGCSVSCFCSPPALLSDVHRIGVYGDVQRVKILYNKKDSALIQMAESHQAYLGKFIRTSDRTKTHNIFAVIRVRTWVVR